MYLQSAINMLIIMFLNLILAALRQHLEKTLFSNVKL